LKSNQEDTSDIETVKQQTDFLRDIQRQLAATGEVILKQGDLVTIEELTQTLNIFRMYLSVFDDRK
jgi:hypothetical protein